MGDDKGGSLAVAQALVALAGKDVSVGCNFGADEELGGFTTTWMVEEKGYRPRRMVIVVDSAYGKIGYATKGQLMVKATLKGKGGHSSAPWKCEDLITRLSAAVVKIEEEWYRRHPLADGVDHWSDVLTPTIIKSEGTALNRIPSEVWVNFNLRSVRPEAKDECVQLIKEVTKGEVEIVRYSPPCVSDGNNPFVQRLKKTPAWANLLIVITADHGINNGSIDQSTPLQKNHIPMLWIGGAVMEPRTIDVLCNQSDLAATLLGQMELPHDDFTFSRDVVSEAYVYPTAVHNYYNAQWLIDSTGHALYDFDAQRFIVSETTDADRLLRVSKAMLQLTTQRLSSQ